MVDRIDKPYPKGCHGGISLYKHSPNIPDKFVCLNLFVKWLYGLPDNMKEIKLQQGWILPWLSLEHCGKLGCQTTIFKYQVKSFNLKLRECIVVFWISL